MNAAAGPDIANNDDDDGGGRDGQFVWMGNARNHVQPDSFGTVILVEE